MYRITRLHVKPSFTKFPKTPDFRQASCTIYPPPASSPRCWSTARTQVIQRLEKCFQWVETIPSLVHFQRDRDWELHEGEKDRQKGCPLVICLFFLCYSFKSEALIQYDKPNSPLWISTALPCLSSTTTSSLSRNGTAWPLCPTRAKNLLPSGYLPSPIRRLYSCKSLLSRQPKQAYRMRLERLTTVTAGRDGRGEDEECEMVEAREGDATGCDWYSKVS